MSELLVEKAGEKLVQPPDPSTFNTGPALLGGPG